MAIMRRSPFDTLRNLEQQLDQFFGRGDAEEGNGSDLGRRGLTSWRPRVDVYQEGNELVFEVDASGINKQDLDVSIENNRLTIQGERVSEQEEEDRDYYRSERVYGTFQRSFALPDNVEGDQVKASYEDGVLTVRTPITSASEESQSIPIE